MRLHPSARCVLLESRVRAGRPRARTSPLHDGLGSLLEDCGQLRGRSPLRSCAGHGTDVRNDEVGIRGARASARDRACRAGALWSQAPTLDRHVRRRMPVPGSPPGVSPDLPGDRSSLHARGNGRPRSRTVPSEHGLAQPPCASADGWLGGTSPTSDPPARRAGARHRRLSPDLCSDPPATADCSAQRHGEAKRRRRAGRLRHPCPDVGF